MHSEIFSKMPPTRLFFHCALPVMATFLAGGLYAIVDGIFVGRYLGTEALAAVNIVMPLIMIVEALANMVAVYLKIYALFGPLIPIYFATDNYLRDCGRPKLSMGINMLTQVLNIVLDFLFIALLGWALKAPLWQAVSPLHLGEYSVEPFPADSGQRFQ